MDNLKCVKDNIIEETLRDQHADAADQAAEDDEKKNPEPQARDDDQQRPSKPHLGARESQFDVWWRRIQNAPANSQPIPLIDNGAASVYMSSLALGFQADWETHRGVPIDGPPRDDMRRRGMPQGLKDRPLPYANTTLERPVELDPTINALLSTASPKVARLVSKQNERMAELLRQIANTRRIKQDIKFADTMVMLTEGPVETAEPTPYEYRKILERDVTERLVGPGGAIAPHNKVVFLDIAAHYYAIGEMRREFLRIKDEAGNA